MAATVGLVWMNGCLTPEGYYRNRGDAGQVGASGGSFGGSTGATGSGGSTAGTGGSVAPGTGGVVVGTGTGGHTGVGGTTGTTGTGGTTGGTGAGGMSGAVLLTDDFESGVINWTPSDSTLGTSTIKMDGSNVLDLDGTTSKIYLVGAGNTLWTDVVIQARVKIISFAGSSSSYYAGVCVRVHDIMNYYCGALRSDGKLSIRGEISDSGTTLGSSVSVSPAITTGTWYTVKIQVVGSTISYFLNGTMMDQVTDSSITAGAVALAIDNGEAEFDDVTVTVP